MANALLLQQIANGGLPPGTPNDTALRARMAGQQMDAQRQQMQQNALNQQYVAQDRQRQDQDRQKSLQEQQMNKDILDAAAPALGAQDETQAASAYQAGAQALKQKYPDLQIPPQYPGKQGLFALVAPHMPAGVQEKLYPALFGTQKAAEPFSLNPGERRYDASGKLIAAAPDKPAAAGAGTPFEKESDKLYARKYQQLQSAAANSDASLAEIASVEQTLPEAFTGTGAGYKQAGATVANFLSGGSAYSGNLEATQRLQSFLGKTALELRNPSGGAGMPGALSDKDREFLQQMAGSINNQTGRLQNIIAAAKALEQRKQDVASLADDYVQANGKLDAGFEKQLKQWSATHPLSLGSTPSAAPATNAGVTVSTPDGHTFQFPSQQAADAWKAKNGL